MDNLDFDEIYKYLRETKIKTALQKRYDYQLLNPFPWLWLVRELSRTCKWSIRSGSGLIDLGYRPLEIAIPHLLTVVDDDFLKVKDCDRYTVVDLGTVTLFGKTPYHNLVIWAGYCDREDCLILHDVPRTFFWILNNT